MGNAVGLAVGPRVGPVGDTVGSGVGEYVLIVQGSSARLTDETKSLPVDAAIIGIVDAVHVESACVYDRDENETD